MNSGSTWQFNSDSAIGSSGRARIEVFPSAAATFARLQTGNDHDRESVSDQASWDIFAVQGLPSHAATPEEIYAREKDLIVRFQQTPVDQFAFQLDWQLIEAERPITAAIELWLSIQTSLLDTKPELAVTCRAPQNRTWQVRSHAELCQANSLEQQTLETKNDQHRPAAIICKSKDEVGVWLIEPTDQCHVQVIRNPEADPSSPGSTKDSSDFSSQSLGVFGHFMEKGVIRRARMRFLVAEAAISDIELARAYQEFASSPLPLTA